MHSRPAPSIAPPFVIDPTLWSVLNKNLALPPQQAAILKLVLSGFSDKRIAAELGRSVPTIRTHLTRLFQRFGVNDRVGIILFVFAEAQQLWKSGLLHQTR